MNLGLPPPDHASTATVSTSDRTWANLPKTLTHAVSDLIFPPICTLCSEPVQAVEQMSQTTRHRIQGSKHPDSVAKLFCRRCETSLNHSGSMMQSACRRCGWPAFGNVTSQMSRDDEAASADARHDQRRGRERLTSQELRCPKCQSVAGTNPATFAFDEVTALYRYHDVVCTAVVAAKYPRHAAISKELGRRLGHRLLTKQTFGDDSRWLVTHVPSPLWRRIRRGGSGIELLAAAVAQTIDRPVSHLLSTTRNVAKQAWLKDEDRRSNVAGAFRVRSNPFHRSFWNSAVGQKSCRLDDCNVLLVDDVMTTGSTANEVARTLKASGAVRVHLAVIARAIRDS